MERTVIAMLVLAAATSTPTSADAQSLSFEGLDRLRDVMIGAGVAAASVAELSLLGFTFDRLAQGHGFKPGWAVAELLWGLSEVGVGSALIWGSFNGRGEVIHPALMGGGIPLILLGLLHSVHAFYSFEEGGPPRVTEEPSAPAVDVDVTTTAGGAYLRVSGSF